MTTDLTPEALNEIGRAYDEGRRAGLATGALLIGIVSFISMLGAEKAAVAITLGVLALRGATHGRTRRMARSAILLGALFIATVAIVLVLFRDKFAELVRLLHQLS